ncbi:MAG TPA: hypothetical protein VL527_10955 [Dongiaceae bacterium]|jgi:hypothetical protein|nr:hypothetical protein [Dongiaceae bacterium]
MKTSRLWYWAPRVLGLLFAGFISLFALDVFQEHRGFGETAIALLIHLIPTGILLLILAAAWRREWLGALLYPGLGAFYIVAFWGRFPPLTYVMIAGPLVLVGVLFLGGWLQKRKSNWGGGAATGVAP